MSKNTIGVSGINARAHIRHAVELPAQLSIGHYIQRPATIRDFCLGGMLVVVPAGERALLDSLKTDDVLKLDVEVQGFRGVRTATVTARLIRQSENALGIAFVAPNATDLLAIQNHVRRLTEEGSAANPAAQKHSDKAQLQTLSRRLLADTGDFFGPRLASLFTRAHDIFFQRMEQAAINEQQLLWAESQKLLKRHESMIERHYLQALSRPIEQLMTGDFSFLVESKAQEQSSNNRLSLVDKDSFEEWLALKVMSSRAENLFNEQILEVQLRLAEVYQYPFSARQNPLHPQRLCTAFGESLKGIPFRHRSDRVLYSAFEDKVVSELGDYYQTINTNLAAMGVLPDLDIARHLSVRAPRPVREKPATEKPIVPVEPPSLALQEEGDASRDAAATSAPSKEAQPSRPLASGQRMSLAARQFTLQQHIAQHAYETARRLLIQPSAAVNDDTPGSTDEAGLGIPLALEQLKALQQEAPLPPDAFEPWVSSQLLSDQHKQLDPGLMAGIRIIDGLFSGITDNRGLTERARKALRQLELPFLRLLLQDDSFLLEDKHPARQVLNRMARLGVRGTANLSTHESILEQESRRIAEQYDKDPSVFQHSLSVLDELTEKQNRFYLRNMKRVAEASEGRNRILRAREEVAALLEDKVGGREVPRALLALLDAGWKQLLIQTLLRHGRDDVAWQEFSSVLDAMIDAGSALPSHDDLAQLLSLIKKGLSLIDPTQMQNPRLLEELRALLSVSQRQGDNTPPVVTLPSGFASADLPGAQDAEGAADQRWLRRAQSHEVGDWFEYTDDDSIQKVHLAWTDSARQVFVFVNPLGMQVMEYRLVVFARELEAGRIKPTESEDVPAVDRGLEAMVQQVYSQMAHQATHDELSGLINRREFERQLRREFELTGHDLHLAQLDIDQFKVVNHTGGTQAGDSLIKQFAALLQRHFDGSLLARLGGDEFAVLMKGQTPEAALKKLEALFRHLEGERFLCAGKSFSITVSIGLASRDRLTLRADELLRAASTACQTAKEAGGNRIQPFLYDDKDMLRRDQLMGWATRLNEAIDNDQLSLRCQRIETTVPGHGLPSYEILLSIAGAKGEEVAPAEFLQAAEQYNRIHALDRWVLKKSLDWMQDNPAVLETVDHFAINLSGHSLNDPSLLEFLFAEFRRTRVPLNKLCLEVTETVAIANLEEAMDFIRELKHLGCRFSLDDFGSGLASYGHLKSLPVDYIKIDGSFIRDLGQDAADLALVRSINELGHLMGKKTIAEYVETEALRQLMQEVGVDYVQGYGVERPRPLDSLRLT